MTPQQVFLTRHPRPTRMLVGAGEGLGSCRCRSRATAGTVSHSPDRGPMVPHPLGPSFPNLLAALSKSLPAPRAWWAEAKGRLFEIAELLGENEAILMAKALPDLVARLAAEPGPPGESLRAMAIRIGTPRDDLALLAADKVTGLLRMGSAGASAPPIPGAIAPASLPRPGFLFTIDGSLTKADPFEVHAMTGGIFPAGQIARGVLVRNPHAVRYVAGASELARQGSRFHQEIVGAVGDAMKKQVRSSFVAHYKALAASVARVRRATGALSADDSYARALGNRIAWLDAGDIQ